MLRPRCLMVLVACILTAFQLRSCRDRQNSNAIRTRTECDTIYESRTLPTGSARCTHQFPLCSCRYRIGTHRRKTSVRVQFHGLAYRIRRAFTSTDSTTNSSTKHCTDARAPNGVSRNTKHCGKRKNRSGQQKSEAKRNAASDW